MLGLIISLLLPVLGTTAGSACVFFMKDKMNMSVYRSLLGFAAGVMVAASVWSLLIPSMEIGYADLESKSRVVPTVIGFILGILGMLALDKFTPHEHIDNHREGPDAHLSRTKMLVLAVTIHNIPEGLAVGVTLAGALEQNLFIPMAGALALSVGVAIQNFPEGAIVSMPLRSAGNSKLKSFLIGSATGLVEPAASVLTIFLASAILPILPYLLAFAAGAMIYVVVEELLPSASEGSHSDLPTLGFAVGFILMMVLDVVLG